MSKKTKRKAQERETIKRAIKNEINAQPTRSSNGPARAYDRSARASAARGIAPRSVLIVRIAALVIAVAALAGGIYWSQTTGSSFSAAVIVGLLALGILAGLAFFVAMRPEAVLKRALSLTKR